MIEWIKRQQLKAQERRERLFKEEAQEAITVRYMADGCLYVSINGTNICRVVSDGENFPHSICQCNLKAYIDMLIANYVESRKRIVR